MDYKDLRLPDGRFLADLRVVDLKTELDSRSLSKTGNKKELMERLAADVVKSVRLPGEAIQMTEIRTTQETSVSAPENQDVPVVDVATTAADDDADVVCLPVEMVTSEIIPEHQPDTQLSDNEPAAVCNETAAAVLHAEEEAEPMQTETSPPIEPAKSELWVPDVDVHSDASGLDFEEELTEPVTEDLPTSKGDFSEPTTLSLEPQMEINSKPTESLPDKVPQPKILENETKKTFVTITMETNEPSNETNFDESNQKNRKKGLKDTVVVGHIVEAPERVSEAEATQSPSSCIVHIRYLVRPFTLNQLTEILKLYGSVKDVWLDRIKSRAYVLYETNEDAVKCRESLDGCRWPSINPKTLRTDYATVLEFEWMKEHGNSDKIPPKHLWNISSTPGTVPPDTSAALKKISPSTNPKNYLTITVKEDERQAKKSDVRKNGALHPLDNKVQQDAIPIEKTTSVSNKNRLERTETTSRRQEMDGVKTLDQLFRKTKTEPAIYWLPVSDSQKRNTVVSNLDAKNRNVKQTSSYDRRARSRSPLNNLHERRDDRNHINRSDVHKD